MEQNCGGALLQEGWSYWRNYKAISLLSLVFKLFSDTTNILARKFDNFQTNKRCRNLYRKPKSVRSPLLSSIFGLQESLWFDRHTGSAAVSPTVSSWLQVRQGVEMSVQSRHHVSLTISPELWKKSAADGSQTMSFYLSKSINRCAGKCVQGTGLGRTWYHCKQRVHHPPLVCRWHCTHGWYHRRPKHNAWWPQQTENEHW